MNISGTFAGGFLQYLTYLRKDSTTSSSCLADRTGRGSGYKALRNSKTGSPKEIEYCGVQDNVRNYACPCVSFFILILMEILAGVGKTVLS